MLKDQYIKYLLDYLFAKQKIAIRELEQATAIYKIGYYKGTLADINDMIGYLLSEYKIHAKEEKKEDKPLEVKNNLNNEIITLDVYACYNQYASSLGKSILDLSIEDRKQSLYLMIDKYLTGF